jgi:hypothetical protein
MIETKTSSCMMLILRLMFLRYAAPEKREGGSLMYFSRKWGGIQIMVRKLGAFYAQIPGYFIELPNPGRQPTTIGDPPKNAFPNSTKTMRSETKVPSQIITLSCTRFEV